MINIVLMEPQNPGNIGAVARVMANFGFTNLLLINPKCDHLSIESRNRAKHAQNILKKIKVFSKLDTALFDYVIGTTAKLGRDYNIPRSPINSQELGKKLSGKKSNIAILIGREGPGLSNKEINLCDFIVTIPASTKYPTLNISHSVGIILYEIFKYSNNKKSDEGFILASAKEKEVILKKIDSILNRVKFATKEKKDTQKKVWKRILGKSFLTKREAFAMLGFFKKIEK